MSQSAPNPLAPDALALGIDLGGTELRVALIDRAGRIHARRQTPTDAAGGPQAVIAQIAAMAADLPAGARGIGIGAPGPLDPERGVVIDAPTLRGWRDVPIAALLADRLGLPTRLENDANAAALGEARAGAGAGLRHLVYVTVSTGIGGGVIIDGRLLHGRQGMAAEIGHMRLTDAPIDCNCGGQGCWEAVAAGPALALAAGAPSARAVAEAARAGDATALRHMRAEARWLGLGFANLLYLYSPEAIIVGGGVAEALDLMQADIEAALRAQAMPAYRDVPIRRAALGQDAGLVGAASLVWAAPTM